MLVLSRKKNEKLVIVVPPCDKQQTVVVTVVDCLQSRVRLGMDAAKEVAIYREELPAGRRFIKTGK